MRVLVEKSTGHMIESQSHARPGTLLQNALNAGYKTKDIEEKEVSQVEFEAILEAQPKPPKVPTAEERLEALEAAILEMILGGAE